MTILAIVYGLTIVVHILQLKKKNFVHTYISKQEYVYLMLSFFFLTRRIFLFKILLKNDLKISKNEIFLLILFGRIFDKPSGASEHFVALFKNLFMKLTRVTKIISVQFLRNVKDTILNTRHTSFYFYLTFMKLNTLYFYVCAR